MKKLVLIALAAAGVVLAKKQLDKSGNERTEWAGATDSVAPSHKA